MATYRDSIARWSLPTIRVRFAPRVFRQLKAVRLEHGGQVAVIELRRVPYPSAHGGQRTMMVCPCGALVFTHSP